MNNDMNKIASIKKLFTLFASIKKLFTLFFVFVFLLSFVKVLPVVSGAESFVSVNLSDNYVGHFTAYDIMFQSNAPISKDEKIAILFDDKIPIFRNTELAEQITVNGKVVPETPLFLGHEIDIESPLSISASENVKISIPKGILQNPQTIGYFTLSIKVGENTYQSEYYKITDRDTVKDVSLSCSEGDFIITFRTGFDGVLEKYETKTARMGRFSFVQPVPKDFIFIRFSHLMAEGIVSLSKNDITVNGKNPPVNPTIKTHFEGTDTEEKEVAIVVPKDINANSEVKVVIKGISLKEKESGTLYVKVWTSKEFTPVSSNSISVESPYFLKTVCTVTPGTPDGENGFYKSAPNVCLTAESGSLIKEVDTFYSFDGKQFAKYEKPFALQGGSYTLYYYPAGYLKNGSKITENVQSKQFNVDTQPPLVQLLSPAETDNPMYLLKFSISDANFDYAKAEVNGITFVFTRESAELPIYIFGKSISVKITAFDRAGNKTEKTFVIKLSRE